MLEQPEQEASVFPRVLAAFGLTILLGLGLCGLRGRGGLDGVSVLGAFFIVIGIVGLVVALLTRIISTIGKYFQK